MQFLLASAALLALLRPHPVSGLAVPCQAAPGSVVPVTLDIVNADLSPDGFLRSTIVVNGTYPGPPILVQKGDTLNITLNNLLEDPSMRRSTSLDLDGIFFSSEDIYEEDTPFVTACPLAPNVSYAYSVPLGEQTGTFWYHSQLSVQYVDGFRGPLIIYDPEDPLADLYDVDDESTIIQLGDWWHNSSLSLLAGYEATGVVPVSDTGTVNGIGRFNGGPEVPFSVVSVEPGKRYRLRIINESARNVFTFSIDNHNLTVIEADGVATQPLTVDKIELLAGQRYSVVLEANQDVANYWINAPHVGGNPAVNPNQNATLSRAVLRYAGAEEAEPTTPMTLGPDPGNPLVEAELKPFVASPPPPADINMTFVLEVIAGTAIWNVNNVSYVPPKTPTLVKVLDGASDRGDFNETENTFILPPNKTIQIEFPANEDDDAHPFHMHGMNFWVVKSNTTDTLNEVDPPIRDTVGAGAAGTIIRFSTDKVGPFFFHCHIFWHMQAGLATVLLPGPEVSADVVQPTPAWEALCPAYDALPPELQ